jgi:hypothetical protein
MDEMDGWMDGWMDECDKLFTTFLFQEIDSFPMMGM